MTKDDLGRAGQALRGFEIRGCERMNGEGRKGGIGLLRSRRVDDVG